jgi:LysM repeat protein
MNKVGFILGFLALVCLSPVGFCCAQSAVQEGRMLSDAPAGVKEQVERLHSFDPVERRNAAQELGRMGEEAVQAVPSLIRALNDNASLDVRRPEADGSPSSVAEAAMLALANIGTPAVDPLIASLRNDNPGVRTMAVDALGRIQDPRTIEPLIEVLERDQDSLVQAAAVDALRKKKDARALEALLLAEQNGSWVVSSLARSAVEEARAVPGEEVSSSPGEPPQGRETRAAGKETGEAKGIRPAREASEVKVTDEDLIPWGGGTPPSEEADVAEPAGEVNHTVQRDETLYRIGLQYGLTWQTLMEYNDLRDPTDLYVGQVLKIPARSGETAPRAKAAVAGTAAAAAPYPESPGKEQTYIVQQGETLYRIGLRYGVTWQALMTHNNMQDPSELSAGQELKIPLRDVERTPLTWDGVTTYTVQPGDILYDIGLLFGMSWREVAAFNGLTDPNQIYVGQVLRIPKGNLR